MIKTITAMKARQNLGSIMNEVSFTGDEFIIERAGKPMAVIVSINKFYAMKKNIENIDMSEDLPMTEINAQLGGFDFLKEEPDLYSIEDLKKRYV
jgi:prevent-host-death family protein